MGTWKKVVTENGVGTISQTAAVASAVTVTDTTDTTCSVALFETATGDVAAKTDGAITYNAGTGALTSTSFAGDLTGDVNGNLTGTVSTPSQGDITTLAGVTSIGATSATVANQGASTIAETLGVTGVATFTAEPIANAGISVKNGATGGGFVKFFEDSDNGSNNIKIVAPADIESSLVWTLPSDHGVSNAALTNNGSGGLTWTLPSGTTLDTTTNNAICTVTGENAITGETGLSFDGSDLGITGNIEFDNASARTIKIADTSTDGNALTISGSNSSTGSNKDGGGLNLQGGTGSGEGSGGAISFKVSPVGDAGTDANAVQEVFSISNSGAAAVNSVGSFVGDVTIAGDLTVSGSTVTVNTANLTVQDKNVILGEPDSAFSDDAAAIVANTGGGISIVTDSTTEGNYANFTWITSKNQTGWCAEDTAGGGEFEVSTMEYSGSGSGPGSNNAAGIGSFHFDTGDAQLYVRSA